MVMLFFHQSIHINWSVIEEDRTLTALGPLKILQLFWGYRLDSAPKAHRVLENTVFILSWFVCMQSSPSRIQKVHTYFLTNKQGKERMLIVPEKWKSCCFSSYFAHSLRQGTMLFWHVYTTWSPHYSFISSATGYASSKHSNGNQGPNGNQSIRKPFLSQLEKVVCLGWLSLKTYKLGCDFPGAVIRCYFAEFHQRQL